MKRIYFFLYLLLILSFSMQLFADSNLKSSSLQNSTSDKFKISVLTIGPGEALFARFGHIALIVEDLTSGQNIVYNFGTFNFTDPKLRIKYARGFLNYWLSYTSLDIFLNFYAGENRDVWIQTLNLTPGQAADIANKLKINALPKNRFYAYRHYIDNCCTRIRDIIDKETDESITKKFKHQKVDRDFRYWTNYSLRGIPVVKWIILYSLGPAIDHRITRWDEEFLPSVLFKDLNEIKLKNNKPLVLNTRQVLKREGPPIGSSIPSLDLWILSLLTLFLAAGLLLPSILKNQTVARRLAGLGLIIWGLISGLGGLMLILYWTVTTHYDTHYNENLIVTPVTHLLLLGPGIVLLIKSKITAKIQKMLIYYLLFANGLVILDLLLKLGPFIQGNYGTIALALICNTLAIFAIKRSNTRKEKNDKLK